MRSSGTFTSSWRVARLPTPSRPVDGTSSKSTNTRGPRLKLPHAAPGLARDDTANGERRLADDDGLADAQPERRQHLRADERAVVLQERMGVGLTAFERDAAVEGELALHRFELDHPGDRA